MEFIADLHTHTVLSGHAFSTIRENVQAAGKSGLLMMANTDHGPAMPGASQAVYHFLNQCILPEEIGGVRILRGAEVNILGDQGRLDVSPEILARLDVVIASLHDVTIEQGDAKTNTDRMIGVIEGGMVDIIGHPGNPYFPLEAERLVQACKRYEVALEVNNTSMMGKIRPGSRVNMVDILSLCKAEQVMVSVGSDAHWMDQVGRLEAVSTLLDENGFPESLVVGVEVSQLRDFLVMRGERRRAAIKSAK
jgi:putative hydrolase